MLSKQHFKSKYVVFVFSYFVVEEPMKFIYLTAEPTGLENPYGERSLADYSLWGHKQSDTTERLSSSSVLKYIVPQCSHSLIKGHLVSSCLGLLQ